MHPADGRLNLIGRGQFLAPPSRMIQLDNDQKVFSGLIRNSTPCIVGKSTPQTFKEGGGGPIEQKRKKSLSRCSTTKVEKPRFVSDGAFKVEPRCYLAVPRQQKFGVGIHGADADSDYSHIFNDRLLTNNH
ncbi:hypothetical protein CEXT_389201 [Caerostris extrusa]|uniref:Uncharacterized protein n=1 Tax=Caerostris extrusa TaxID=172846 RepID=A0AAV4PNP4_CAEEX|nr:hypothetical protein CEXT_389201 [Caerostris extrusa]